MSIQEHHPLHMNCAGDDAFSVYWSVEDLGSVTRKPCLEVVDAQFADKDLLLSGDLEVDGQSVVEPQVDVLHGVA